MTVMNDVNERLEKIQILMEYAVPEGVPEQALDLLEIYKEDKVALDLLQEFYSYLPEAENDCVCEIRLLGRRKGVFLLGAVTLHSGYIYLLSSEGIEFQGHLADGLWDKDLLEFFGFESKSHFRKQCSKPENFSLYEPIAGDSDICPACHVETGEDHELGCPVEVCPWCGGQFAHCNCRFEQLGLDQIESEEELVRLAKMLEDRGRIPYAPEQRPGFLQE